MGKYDDIIKLERPKSKHPHMSTLERAAQFSPFAALSGYGASIQETTRLTDEKTELSDSEKDYINSILEEIAEKIPTTVTVTFFKPDEKKNGGKYITVTDSVIALNASDRMLSLSCGEGIPLEDIISLQIEKRQV